MILQIANITISFGVSRQAIMRSIYDWRLKRAIKKADRLARWHNRTYVVIQFGGWPKVYSRAVLKDAVKRRTIFKAGTKMEYLDRMTLYKTR